MIARRFYVAALYGRLSASLMRAVNRINVLLQVGPDVFVVCNAGLAALFCLFFRSSMVFNLLLSRVQRGWQRGLIILLWPHIGIPASFTWRTFRFPRGWLFGAC